MRKPTPFGVAKQGTKLYSVREVAAALDIGVHAVRHHIHRQGLGLKMDDVWILTEEDFIAIRKRVGQTGKSLT
jgi:hypothetical protein